MSCRSGLNKNKKIPSDEEQQILLECFTPDYNDLVSIGHEIGAPALNCFLDMFGGTKPHIPKKAVFWGRLETTCRDEKMRGMFNGCNHQELADLFDLTLRQVYRIVHGN